MKTKSSKRNYIAPTAKVKNIYAECAGIGIGSGETAPEECDTNNSSFDELGEQPYITTKMSVWDN